MKPLKRPYSQRQMLICTNSRDPVTGKPSCGMNGSAALRERLKMEVKARGLKGTVMVTTTGCMDVCPSEGCVVAFYPEGEFALSPTGIEVDAGLLERLLRE